MNVSFSVFLCFKVPHLFKYNIPRHPVINYTVGFFFFKAKWNSAFRASTLTFQSIGNRPVGAEHSRLSSQDWANFHPLQLCYDNGLTLHSFSFAFLFFLFFLSSFDAAHIVFRKNKGPEPHIFPRFCYFRLVTDGIFFLKVNQKQDFLGIVRAAYSDCCLR